MEQTSQDVIQTDLCVTSKEVCKQDKWGIYYGYYNSTNNFILHREGHPAREDDDGSLVWARHGYRHRLDGPAVILSEGSSWWFRDGLQHRLDGPAFISKNGSSCRWFVWGNNISLEVKKWLNETTSVPNDYTQWNNSHKMLFKLRFG